MLAADPNLGLEPEALDPEQIRLVRHHLQEVMMSHAFAGSKRTQDFLQLIVGHALSGQLDSLRERMIGAEMFGRPIDYDTGSDSVVRVKATEVRRKLAQFYQETKDSPDIRIELRSGSYVPRFHFRQAEIAAPLPPPPTSTAEPPNSHSEPSGLEKSGANVQHEAGFYRKRPRNLPRIIGGTAITLAVVAVIGYASFMKWSGISMGRSEIRSIAILPLENLSGDPAQEYFADGMTEELINELGQVSTLRVISMTSSMTYKGTKKKLPEIAHELAVDGVVEGGVLREGNRVRISAQLVDARTDRPVWAHTYVRDLSSFLAWQGEVAQAIAQEISIKVTPQEQARFTRNRPVDPEAQDLYLHGMLELEADHCKVAIDFFDRALDKNPNYAEDHAALANCYGRMGETGHMPYKEAFTRQKSEGARAVELDDSLPEGHLELANTAMTLDWDWAAAEREFRRALQLNPNSASIHQSYAFYLARTGQMPQALAEVEHGVELDPVSWSSFHYEGFIYYFSRQYDQALSLIQRVSALNIHPPDWSFLLGDVYVEKGMYKESIAEFLKSGDGPDSLGHLGNAFARAGQQDAALKTILKLQDSVRKDGVGRYEIALVYAGLGREQEAFQSLEDAYAAHDVGLVYLKIDPCLDPLRSDPRFDDLMRRVGLGK